MGDEIKFGAFNRNIFYNTLSWYKS